MFTRWIVFSAAVLACAPLRAQQPAPPSTTLVTLKLPEAPPRQVFDDLAKQARTTFATSPDNLWEQLAAKPISVDWNQQPFWLAMRQACHQSGLVLKRSADPARGGIILGRGDIEWTTYPATVAGPFLVSLIGLQRSGTVDMRKPVEIRRQFVARFTLFCEPNVRLLRGPTHAKVEEASDDRGNSLVPKSDALPLTFISSWVHELEAKLEYPKDAGSKIPLLRCSANFVAQTRSETIEVAEPVDSTNVLRTAAGRQITLSKLRQADKRWEAVMVLGRGDLSQTEWEASLFPGHSLRLIDGEGRQIAARGYGLGNQGEQATYVFKFDPAPAGGAFGKPVKLRWEIPVQTVTIPLSWEFKDLPLP